MKNGIYDFHLAPWKTYKGALAAVALAAPIVYGITFAGLPGNAAMSDGFAVRVIARCVLPWLVGWFLILFGDGEWGGMLAVRPLRSYFVTLGAIMLVLPLVRAWVYYDLAARAH